jgi:hypothetical protein
MRRTLWLGLVAGTVTLGGCDGLREAFSPQANVVAVAASRRLPAARLADLLGRIQVPPQEETADLIAGLWVDLQLFAEGWVTGRLTGDSASVARVMWPQILQSRLQIWQDSMAARRPQPTEASVDSVYHLGDVRLFQHILVVPTGTTAGDTAAARDRITAMLAQVRRGADFGALAGQNPDASRDDRGLLGMAPGPRGQFVFEFDQAAWDLAPGEVSDVVATQFGFHLIRRTPLEEVRPRFQDFVERRAAQVYDSTYISNLARAHDLRIQPNAPQLMKEAAKDPYAARRSGRRLATYRGGPLTVGDFARWLEALQPGQARQLESTPDSILRSFAEAIAQNELVIRQMDSIGLTITGSAWQSLQLTFRATVDQIAADIGLADSVVVDTTLARGARLDSAASRVERYLDRLMVGEAQYRPFPSSFTAWLRERGRYRVNRGGIARAVEMAQARADTTPALPPAPIQPAPGGPPVGPEPGR